MNVLVLYSTHITGAHQIKNTTDAYQATIGAHNHVTALPMSDGGQGFLDAIETYATGCRRAAVTVRDTHFRLKDTYYITSQDGKTAYIEAFKICGYDHTDPERNPATAFTHGIGDAIADALSHNCRNFVIGIEEIASIDAGLGMLDALGYKILTDNGNELPLYRGSKMLRACAVADSENAALLKRCRFTIACNDDSAFYAATGPAVRHARRLGANEVTTDILDNGLRNMASVYFHHNGRDVSYIKGGGAGGGVAGAFASFFNAKLKPATTVMPGNKLPNAIKQADEIVIICDSITPAAISGTAFSAMSAILKKCNTRIHYMALHHENAPLLESIGIDNIIVTANPTDDLTALLDRIMQKKQRLTRPQATH